ncbi:quinoprotein relay system zinc metallohydrolase 1 [Marinobacter halodurans]|uniref:Quinoprotein relay system zinc metallohydrolase 1 n=1 Tax=Marinobacter halodurans TaxID=2528979 RepID=A0ABY1ZJV0_9GAMM|nr:quinoprotein relay system zinc metallohydrolase 1 [Marinobacter halodurans]TBW52556.1 quinoprotein relay system zinc metallohydrolase 1 [Marinobacter halodurans]
MTRWCLILLAVMALPAQAALRYHLEPKQIAPDTWMVEGKTENFSKENGGNIVNTAFIVTDAGVVVIDTGPSLQYGDALHDAIRKITDQPVTHVLITHHHPDHAFGNQAFPERSLSALPETTALLERDGEAFSDNMYRMIGDWMRGTQVVLPTQELAPGPLIVGNHTFQLWGFTGHTGADLVILDKTTGTLFAGDMVFYNRAITTPQSPGLDTWQQELDLLAEIPFERLVPGHGPMVTDDRAFRQMHAYMTWLDALFKSSANRGLTANEVMRTPIPGRFDSIAEASYELIRSTTHLYPRYEQAALRMLPEE